MNKKILFTVLLVVYTIAMFAAAALDQVAQIPSGFGSDKIIHFTEFFILMLILLKTFSYYSFKRQWLAALGVAITLAILSEVVQIFVPSRNFSYYDLIADLLGISLALALK